MAQKNKSSSKSKKQSPIAAFFAKLNPNSPKKKLLAFAVVFAIAGGGYYAYTSFAATYYAQGPRLIAQNAAGSVYACRDARMTGFGQVDTYTIRVNTPRSSSVWVSVLRNGVSGQYDRPSYTGTSHLFRDVNASANLNDRIRVRAGGTTITTITKYTQMPRCSDNSK
jgi:hypothetical protein